MIMFRYKVLNGVQHCCMEQSMHYPPGAIVYIAKTWKSGAFEFDACNKVCA